MTADLNRRHSGYTVTVDRDLDTGNVKLQYPDHIDPRHAADTLRRAADIIDRWADLDHSDDEHSPDVCALHPDAPLNLAGSCSTCGRPVRR